jgi:hypothetical protein
LQQIFHRHEPERGNQLAFRRETALQMLGENHSQK